MDENIYQEDEKIYEGDVVDEDGNVVSSLKQFIKEHRLEMAMYGIAVVSGLLIGRNMAAKIAKKRSKWYVKLDNGKKMPLDEFYSICKKLGKIPVVDMASPRKK